VNDVIRKIFGFDQSVNSLERTNRKMSESAEAYWEQLPAPASEEAGALVVVQADGKGVVMRSESDVDEPAQSSSLKNREKPVGKEKNGK
jgi:hypothetical protein